MLYLDYNWDLTPDTMIPDPELNTDSLDWKAGDYWKVVEKDGKKFLRKVDKLEQFVITGSEIKKTGQTIWMS
jgi:hypothetical protein